MELSPEEVEYLNALIKGKGVAEEDVELALSLLKYDKEKALDLISLVIESYPNLLKNVHGYLSDSDYVDMSKYIYKFPSADTITEHELFWLSKIIIDCYELNQTTAEMLSKVFFHPSASAIVKAAILEADDKDNHLIELKLSQLTSLTQSLASSSLIVGLEHADKGIKTTAYRKISDLGPSYKALCDIMS